jgi:hypothetical protein
MSATVTQRYVQIRVWTGGEHAVIVDGIDEAGEPHELWSALSRSGSVSRVLDEADAFETGRRLALEHDCECVEDAT